MYLTIQFLTFAWGGGFLKGSPLEVPKGVKRLKG